MNPRARVALEVIAHAGRCGGRIRWTAARCATAGGLVGACSACGWTRVLLEDLDAGGALLRPDGPPDWLPAAVMAALEKERPT